MFCDFFSPCQTDCSTSGKFSDQKIAAEPQFRFKLKVRESWKTNLKNTTKFARRDLFYVDCVLLIAFSTNITTEFPFSSRRILSYNHDTNQFQITEQFILTFLIRQFTAKSVRLQPKRQRVNLLTENCCWTSISHVGQQSMILIVKTKGDKKSNFPSFVVDEQVLGVFNKFKYLGQIIRDDLCDSDDIQRQCCELDARANMLARNLNKCTDDGKIARFRSSCTS